MQYANLTAVKIGMTGVFAGRSYRVAGRVVMCMEEAGETYWWNEFNLLAGDGSHATLVHEQTERGVEWRLFTMFEPAHPISVAEAATKQVGDTIDLTGAKLRVTCVDESRVCQIEGQAPEGVEDGDAARYFNAESGDEMIVVSWTGNEIEFYRGLTLPAHVVMSAFGIKDVPHGTLRQLSGDTLPDAGKTIKGIVGVIVVLLAVGLGWFWFSARDNLSKAPKLAKAQLRVGDVANLNSALSRITGHAVVEIAEVGKRYLRHEYSVVDDAGHEALLLQGTETGADTWMLLTPFSPERPLTPREAGMLRLGASLQLDEAPMNVAELFLSRAQKVNGVTPLVTGAELYGFVARGAGNIVVARWDENSIRYYRVTVMPGRTPARVRKASGPK